MKRREKERKKRERDKEREREGGILKRSRERDIIICRKQPTNKKIDFCSGKKSLKVQLIANFHGYSEICQVEEDSPSETRFEPRPLV